MSIDLEKAIGFESDSAPVCYFFVFQHFEPWLNECAKVSWNKRDLLLYAVGIGAKKGDLQFVYGEITFPYHT